MRVIQVNSSTQLIPKEKKKRKTVFRPIMAEEATIKCLQICHLSKYVAKCLQICHLSKYVHLKHVSSKDRQNNYDRQTGTFLFFLFFLRFRFLLILAIPLLSFPKEGMISMFCVSACRFWFFFLLRRFFLGGKSTLLDPVLTIADDIKESCPFRLDDGAVNFLTTPSSVSFHFLLIERALPSVETFCSIFKSFLAKSATKNPLV